MNLRTLVLATLVSSAAGPRAAQPAAQSGVPQTMTSAQAEDAIRAARAAIALEPHRSDLWVQIADIEARRGNLTGCVDALRQAVAASPGDASLYARLSQTYASAGSGERRPARHRGCAVASAGSSRLHPCAGDTRNMDRRLSRSARQLSAARGSVPG